MKFLSLVLLFVLFIPSIAQANATFSEEFENFLNEDRLQTHNNNRLFKNDLTSFYNQRDFKPVWFDTNGNDLQDLEKIQKAIAIHTQQHGMNARDYNFNIALEKNKYEREWMLTNTFLHFLNDIQSGRIDPKKFDSLVMTISEKKNLNISLAKALKEKNLVKFFATLSPQQPEYKKLTEKLASYKELEKNGALIKINSNAVIYPGETHKIIPKIRERLETSFKEYDGKLPDGIWIDESQIEGEKLSDVIANRDQVKTKQDKNIALENPDMLYDPKLAKRVAEFQYFHGLKTDGVIGPQTINAFNVPVSKRINQIKLSMERWRWLPSDLGKKHVRVNIAGYYARAVKNGEDEFVMPIIVGKVAHQTPVFSSVIENVKIHPDWTSPDSISKRYVIPKIKRNPSVINTLGYEVIDKNTWQVIPWSRVNISSLNSASTKNYMFRQKPGNKNALGLARFSIVNDQSIFMHGTPNESLFNEDDRNYSSGCIRLEDPYKMAYFLLKDQGMSKRKLSDLYYLEDNEFPDTTIVDLEKDIPVHIMYMTAWIDQKGNIHFNEDVYGRDIELNNALEEFS